MLGLLLRFCESEGRPLVLVLLFLMKLAIFKENLPALRERDAKADPKDKKALPALLAAVQSFVPHNTEPLLATALRLLLPDDSTAALRRSTSCAFSPDVSRDRSLSAARSSGTFMESTESSSA